ncbi:MAG: efflux RND transporter periplasmic adaptor subunit [Gammaproteobacteria bacterium]|nr:efflux RND transporter periplasmic adaptor subunit [Gammaproteobacteria bacterium]
MQPMKRGVAVIALCAVAIFGAVSWYRSHAEGPLVVYGTIEARNIEVGSKEGGRIAEVLVREGDAVAGGTLLLRFEAPEMEARVQQFRGVLALARANLAKMEKGSRPEEIAEARAAAAADAAGFRGAEVAQSRAELERARAELVNAELRLKRARDLRSQDLVPQQALDDAEAAHRSARAAVDAANRAVNAAQGRLEAARAVTARVESGFRSEEVEAARAELQRAEGALLEAEARYAEREVRVPADAVVETLDVRPGDLIAPGKPVAKLLEAGQMYIMIYVPETRIGAVRLGQRAELRVNSFPGETFPLTVEQIRQQAEFLPRNVQTPEERVHQVIGVKLRLDRADQRLRAGMSAQVTFPS